ARAVARKAVVNKPLREPLVDHSGDNLDLAPDNSLNLRRRGGRGRDEAVRVPGVDPPAHEESREEGLSDSVTGLDCHVLVLRDGHSHLGLGRPQVDACYIPSPGYGIRPVLLTLRPRGHLLGDASSDVCKIHRPDSWASMTKRALKMSITRDSSRSNSSETSRPPDSTTAAMSRN